jgi:hypothetical protein
VGLGWEEFHSSSFSGAEGGYSHKGFPETEKMHFLIAFGFHPT